MKTLCNSIALLCILMISAIGEQKGLPESGWYFMPHVEYEGQSSADYSNQDGGFSRNFLGGEIGFKRYMPRESYFRLYARYGEHRFDFEDAPDAANLFANPFETIAEEEVGAILLHRLENGWGYYARAGFVSMRDPDAHLVNSTEARFLGIVGYRFSDKLEMGLGALAKSQISQSPRFYPLPVINYTFNDRLRLITSEQIDLSYSIFPQLTTVILSSAPERLRMRLDESDGNQGGIAEYQRVPLSLSLDQIVHKNVKITLTGTVIPYHKLQIENADGEKLDEAEIDSALQFSAKVAFRF
jgi:hypothetical protein